MELPSLFRAMCIIFRAFQKTLGKGFEGFKSCDTAGKSCFILGTELWGSHYEELLYIVKSYIIDIWEVHKSKLYDWHWFTAVSKSTREVRCLSGQG